MGQVFAAIVKAVMVTLVSTLAAIAVDRIRQYNDDKNEADWNQPGNQEYDHW